MTILSNAKQFLDQSGRDIDRACYAYHFDGGSLDDLLTVLSRYQNEDGGFTRLEVDIAGPDSNPFATELALLICIQAEVPANHPLLMRTAAYLEATQHPDGDWRFTADTYQHELAPWFKGWTWPNLNPACTTAGLLKALGLGSAQLHQRVEALFQRLAQPEELTDDSFYAVRPYAFYFLPDWSHPQRDFYLSGLLWWLIGKHATDTIEDAPHFFEYIRTPQTYLGRALPSHIIDQRLDQLTAEQQDDGGWPSPYNAAWRPWVTVQSLVLLKAFGRIER